MGKTALHDSFFGHVALISVVAIAFAYPRLEAALNSLG